MKHSNAYLFFNGNCKTAMETYQKIFGGELNLKRVGDIPKEEFKGVDPDRVMHSHLIAPNMQLMASDNMREDTTVGDNVCLFVECSSPEEVDRFYAALAKDGEPAMKPDRTFWGAYFGSLTDAFGVSWMLSATL